MCTRCPSVSDSFPRSYRSRAVAQMRHLVELEQRRVPHTERADRGGGIRLKDGKLLRAVLVHALPGSQSAPLGARGSEPGAVRQQAPRCDGERRVVVAAALA
jgi:hypothetical protein